jgi:hypothetical protein
VNRSASDTPWQQFQELFGVNQSDLRMLTFEAGQVVVAADTVFES